QPSTNFQAQIADLNGFLSFFNNPLVKLNLDGELGTSYQKTPVHFAGDLDLNSGYWLNMIIKDLDLRVANQYLPPKSVTVVKGRAGINCYIGSSEKEPKPGELPLDLRMEVRLKDGELQSVVMPEQKIEKLSGSLQLDRTGVKAIALQMVFLDTQWKLGGAIKRYDQLNADLSLEAEKFVLARLNTLSPVFTTANFSGETAIKIAVREKLTNPKISLALKSPELVIYQQSFTDIDAMITYSELQARLNIEQIHYAQGMLKGTGFIDLRSKEPRLFIESFLTDMQLAQVMGVEDPRVTGNIYGKVVLEGTLNNLGAYAKLHSREALVYGQQMNYLELNAKITPDKVELYKNTINLNQAPISFSAYLDSSSDFKLNINGNKVLLTDQYGQFFKDGDFKDVSRAIVDLALELKGNLNEAFLADPLRYISGKLSFAAKDSVLMDQKIDSAEAEITLEDQLFTISQFQIISSKSKMDILGTIDLKKQADLMIDGLNVDLTTLGILKYFLPKNLKSIKGTGNLSLKIKGDLAQPKKDLLQKLIIESKLNLRDFAILEQPLDSIKTELNWNGQKLLIKDLDGSIGKSYFKLHGQIGLDQNIDLAIAENSVFHLDDFSVLLRELGYISGTTKLSGSIKGKISRPELDIKSEISDFKLNDLSLDKISGKISWKNQQLVIKDVEVKQLNDVYELSGLVNFSSDKVRDFNLRMYVPSGDLTVMADLFENMVKEATRLTAKEGVPTSSADPAVADTNKLRYDMSELGDQGALPLYQNERSQGTAIGYISRVQREVELIKRPQKLGLVSQVKGAISGQLDISITNNRLNAQADFAIQEGTLSSIEFKKLQFTAQTVAEGVRINMDFNKGAVAGGPFELIKTQSLLSNAGWLKISQFDMTVKGRTQRNVISGDIPIEAAWNPKRSNDKMNLRVQLEEDSVGIIGIFNRSFEEIKNKGKIYLQIGGTLEKPVFNGELLEFKEAQIVFNPQIVFIESPFNIQKAEVSLRNNRLEIKELKVAWQGKDTQNRKNIFDISGSVELTELTFLKPEKVVFDLDLYLKDTKLSVNLPKLYTGELALRDLSLRGPFTQPISDKEKQKVIKSIDEEEESAPVFSGEVTLSDGKIPMPEIREPTIKPGMRLNLKANIGNEVFVNRGNMIVAGNDVVSNIMGNFDFQLRKTKEPLIVQGSLNTPAVEGQVILDKGSLSSFLKEFQLVERENKKVYFKNREEIKDNAVVLSMIRRKEGENRRKLQPAFQVVASTIIDVPVKMDSGGTSVNSKIFLVILNGPINDLRSISFAKYSDPPAPRQPELEAEYYLLRQDGSTIDFRQLEDLYYALMPSLIRDLPEILSEGLQSSKSQDLIRKYTSSQADVWMHSTLRPYEKEIAQNIGLYDLKLQRDFGKDFNNLAFGTDNSVQDTKLLGLDLVSELMADRVFITLNTEVNKDLQTDNFNLTFSSYKLTISLLREFIFDDISINIQRKIDAKSTAEQTFAIEANHRF
ncbi:MAG: hypothetical protein WC838_04685, partial [Candidatus Margulisiibacteriota bacterium]